MSVTVIVKGKTGVPGGAPAHQWNGTQIRFTNADGSWGSYVDVAFQETLAPVLLTGNYTLTAADDGKVFVSNTTGDITITVPNSLPPGVTATLIRGNSGNLSVAAGSGATNRSGGTHISAQFEAASIYVFRNSGSAAEFLFSGQTS